MNNNFSQYWKNNRRLLIPLFISLLIVHILPPFNLFEDRSSSLLQVHLLLELFAVIVAILIAIVSWYEHEMHAHPDSAILLIGFSTVAVVDLLHALTYDGMPKLVTENSTQRAIFFWLAGRTLVLLTLALLAFQIKIKISNWLGLLFAGSCASLIFWFGTFEISNMPVLYIKGTGVTGFKSVYEYILFGLNVLLAGVFIRKADWRDPVKNSAFATSCLIMALGEIVFSNYIAPSDFLNNFGHLFKVLSYYVLYQSVFVSAIRQPYQKIRESEERFRTLTELSADWFWEQDAQLRFSQISKGVSPAFYQFLIRIRPWEIDALIPVNFEWSDYRMRSSRREPFKDLICKIEKSNQIYWISSSASPVYDEQRKFAGYRGVTSDITKRKMSELQIEFLAYHDSLTALPNRIMLQDRFEQFKSYAIQKKVKLALLFLDLDHFKKINDSSGHDIGDAMLKDVAKRLEECVRKIDSVARIGGDEFLILIPDLTKTEDVVQVVEKIIENLQKPFYVNHRELTTSASVGISIFPDDAENFESLRKNADIAMYRAKDSGRNIYRFFDDGMNADATNYMVLRNGLRHAIERQELVLHYQPQLNLYTGEIIGVEALIRWNHPEMGIVSPAKFIPIAEESGLIIPIGDWVLKEACRQAVAWNMGTASRIQMAVNLSGVQFRRGDVEQSVFAALDESGLDPSLLELELTESILIQNAEHALACVKRLKSRGIKLSIDDFGTGYSSLSYLKRFDIDKLKIDQSFVRELNTNENDATIVRAIIQMAHGLNLVTIAEGVEITEILETLRSFGCDQVQGYLLSKPLPAAGLEKFMSAYTANPQGELVSAAEVD
ncbi:bifunctional diguanylate cyclase/phosphodiesterase [Undibacterium oligocarboniphilum]|uniref:EAL domain-containing protein n=1 Tax=Undibacterium oligocarboniphilum TaxID=666702 RepID=A0A850QCX3_9BURK|nr:EAL domain-containing protein [Undibacterium oligocarboniphilum]MBC3868716.1 EAL domain-containing protein [Undibacterium oligocarboniphilum]NVO76697.1 EAL domain-containing protein [Undibacterium oligocarboniphilum]